MVRASTRAKKTRLTLQRTEITKMYEGGGGPTGGPAPQRAPLPPQPTMSVSVSLCAKERAPRTAQIDRLQVVSAAVLLPTLVDRAFAAASINANCSANSAQSTDHEWSSWLPVRLSPSLQGCVVSDYAQTSTDGHEHGWRRWWQLPTSDDEQ